MREFLKYTLCMTLVLMLSSCLSSNERLYNSATAEVEEEVYENEKTGDRLVISDGVSISRPKQDNEARVALLLPLNGENAKLGKHLLDATQLAMYDLNASNIHLVPIDTSMGVKYMQDKLEVEQPDIILGPLYSTDTLAVYPYAKKNNICMITFSNNEELAGKDCLFMLGIMPQEAVTRISRYAQAQKLPDINAVLPNSQYGKAVESSLAELNNKNKEHPIKIIGRYNQSSIDYDLKQISANITKHAQNETTLLIPEGGNSLQSFVSDLRGQKGGKKVKYLGSGMWEDKRLLELPELNGAWFATTPRQDRENFARRFEENFNYLPSNLASLAYDGIALISVVSKNGLERGNLNKNILTNKDGFRGITGVFRFKPDGTNERAMAVYEIRKDGFLEIDPAPSSFTQVDKIS
jgi:ABC-type branched-subunit amino acid transport system substrate-binding protein